MNGESMKKYEGEVDEFGVCEDGEDYVEDERMESLGEDKWFVEFE